MDDLAHQMMKEWYWFAIFGALCAIFFCPSFLKSKCPKCTKRNLTTVDVDDSIKSSVAPASDSASHFLTFYRCGSCQAKLYRQRTGPFQDASAPKWNNVFEHAEAAAVAAR